MTLAILYVDDDPDIRHIVALSLSIDPEIDVKVAASGMEALDLLDGAWQPDIAVLDVMMPGMDGPTLLAHIHDRPALSGLPVLFMTARGRSAEVAEYRARGAIGAILKPFDPVRLAPEIRSRLEAYRSRDAIAS